jgi:hypothetical protein
MEQMTVRKLYLLLAQEVKNGNGEKAIVVADDNEGNAYHGLFYGITSNINDIKENVEFSNGIYDSREKDLNKIVILG